MWISEKVQKMLTTTGHEVSKLREELGIAIVKNLRLELENSRLRSDLDWFKLRMNAVEKERQMLILDRIGVKIPVPEFVPVTDLPSELAAVNELPDLSIIGNDAPDSFNPAQALGPDYSGLPVRTNN